jgi:hypothetical protein
VGEGRSIEFLDLFFRLYATKSEKQRLNELIELITQLSQTYIIKEKLKQMW